MYPNDTFVTLKPWLWWDCHRQRRIHIKNLAGFCKIPEDLQLSNSCKKIFLAEISRTFILALSLAFDEKMRTSLLAVAASSRFRTNQFNSAALNTDG